MSVRTKTFIECDVCFCLSDLINTYDILEFRKELGNKGWGNKRNIDICPNCNPDKKGAT